MPAEEGKRGGVESGICCAQVGEYGEHAAVVVPRWRQSKLGEEAGDMLLDVTDGEEELFGDGRVRTSFGHQ
jgi:hypothetical protein